MTVYFHGSFGLRREYLAGVLTGSLKKQGISDAALAKPFGYGAPFTTKYRSWLHKTGLIEGGIPLRLTLIGKIVVKHDPSLARRVTKWLLHYELTTDPIRAEAWHYFVHEFLTKHRTFARGDLLTALEDKLSEHSVKHFGPGSKLTRTIVRKILECYTEDYALGSLEVITPTNGGYSRGDASKKIGPWGSPEELTRAYARYRS